MDKKRTRNKLEKFFVTENEAKLIELKMENAGITNKSAYLRKVSLDGYIIKQDFGDLKAVIRELNKIGVNINQIAKVANTYGAEEIRGSDLQEIRKEIRKIWQQLDSLILK